MFSYNLHYQLGPDNQLEQDATEEDREEDHSTIVTFVTWIFENLCTGSQQTSQFTRFFHSVHKFVKFLSENNQGLKHRMSWQRIYFWE